MAVEGIQQQWSAPATANLGANQFAAVTFDTSGGVSIAAAGKNADGFLQNKPAAGQAAQVAVFGVTKVQVSSTTTVGQLLQVDTSTNGTLVPVSSGTAVAKALSASGTITSGVVTITALILKSAAVYS